MKRNTFTFFVTFLTLCCRYAFAQDQLMVYGDVKDENNKPIAGAVIKLKNRPYVKATDNNGRFDILVIDVDTLVVSFIGYKTVQKPITSKLSSVLHIRMDPQVSDLKEVVVSTGYQDIPKERATGSFYKLDHQLLDQRVGTNIINRIEGLTSGLQIDRRDPNQQTIQIRGLSTLNTETAVPLIVLDNFPYSGDINNINPNDIESVTVLKDAAASSIWGARAGNGVIVINTKRAKALQPLQVSFNSNISLKTKPDLLSAKQISVSSIIDLEKDLYGRGYYNSSLIDPSFPAIPEVIALLERAKKGEITSGQANQQIEKLRSQDVRNDFQRYLYRNEIAQQYYLNLTGAGSNIRYLISAGYDKSIKNLRGNDDNRITVRSNNQIDLTKNWILNTDLIVTRTNAANNSPGAYGSYSYNQHGISPYARLINDDGSPAAIDLKYSKAFTDTAGNGRLLDWKYRPLQELETSDKRSAMTDLLLNVGSTWKILRSIKADLKYQYQQSWSASTSSEDLTTFSTRDYINTFTQFNSTGAVYPVPKQGILYDYDLVNRQQALRGQLSFDHLWANRHRLTAIAGSEVRESRSNSTSQTIYGYDKNTLTTIAVDYANLYPTYDNINGDSYISNGTQLKAYLNRFVSVFANAAYTFDSRYTLTVSARRDESNLFGVKTNQKGVPLWSAGGLWKVNREKFYNVSWLPELNLRLTYGVSGNLSPNESALTRIQTLPASLNPIRLPFISVSAPPNPGLRWEQVKTLNIGTDFSLLNDRLSGTFEYYTKRSTDLINSVILDPTLGFGSSSQNSASIFTRGMDIVLNTVNLNGDLKWRSTLLFSQVKFTTTKNLNPPPETGLVSDGNFIFPVLGQNPYVIVSYKWAGLDPSTGDPQGFVNGTVSKDYAAIEQNPLNQQVISGSALPTVFGTLRNTLDWRNFSLAFNISYRLNYYFRKPTTYYSSLMVSGAGYKDFEERWQKPGDELRTNAPSFVYPANSQRESFYHYSSVNVEKADNIKLEEIYLSYNIFPKRPLLGVRSLQLYLFANQLNLILWKANKAGIDPDRLYNYKTPESFSAGIKFTL